MIKLRQTLGLLLLTAAGLVIYGNRLDGPPPGADELVLQQQARSIAATGRDLDGRLLPMYFHVRDNIWAQPLPVYFSAAFFTVGGERASRVRPFVLAAIDAMLIYLIARRLFGRDELALLAAALLILTPAHFVYGRLAPAFSYSVPYILAWLLCLIAFESERRPWLLLASTLFLGLGFYADPPAVLMMPALFVLTLVTVWLVRGTTSLYAAASVGFVMPLLILIPWFVSYHDVFRFTLGDWGFHTIANPIDGLRYTIFNWVKVGRRLSLYWDFFSPSSLFFPGGAADASAGRHGTVFLGLTVVPLVYGLCRIVTSLWPYPLWRVVLFGFLLAPMAAATFDEPRAIWRALGLVPFGVLIAVAGFDGLFSNRRRAVRVLAFGILVLMPLQFYRFVR